jgi:hypothetical protein
MMRSAALASVVLLSAVLASCSSTSVLDGRGDPWAYRDAETSSYADAIIAGMVRAEQAREMRRSAERRRWPPPSSSVQPF